VPIPVGMKLERTIEKISTVFAEAVAAGRFAEAEGWIAVARLAAGRDSGLIASTNVLVLEPEPRPPA